MWILVVGFGAATGHATAQSLPSVFVSAQTPIVEPPEVVAADVRISGATEPYRVTIDTRARWGRERATAAQQRHLWRPGLNLCHLRHVTYRAARRRAGPFERVVVDADTDFEARDVPPV